MTAKETLKLVLSDPFNWLCFVILLLLWLT
jgi:hypothetical protein